MNAQALRPFQMSAYIKCNCRSLPPPRPLHRYPSWENRIYQVASEGMKDAISTGTGDSIDSTNNNSYRSDINVPVYATVKGVSGSRTLLDYNTTLLTTTL